MSFHNALELGRHSAFGSQYSEPERASSKVSSFGSMQNQSSRSSAPSSSRLVVTVSWGQNMDTRKRSDVTTMSGEACYDVRRGMVLVVMSLW